MIATSQQAKYAVYVKKATNQGIIPTIAPVVALQDLLILQPIGDLRPASATSFPSERSILCAQPTEDRKQIKQEIVLIWWNPHADVADQLFEFSKHPSEIRWFGSPKDC